MRAKLRFVLSITILFSGFYGFGQQDYWQKVQSSTVFEKSGPSSKDTLYKLDNLSFERILNTASTEEGITLQFPDNSGNLITYQIWETSNFHPDLAKKYPRIKSFAGESQEGQSKIRFSYSPNGLKAMMIPYGEEESVFLEPEEGQEGMYQVYGKGELSGKSELECSTPSATTSKGGSTSKALVDEQILRKYRIAVSTTGEYTNYHGGTVADALAAINATLTRINAVFETDLGVTLELIPNNDEIIFTNAATDPYTGSLSSQVQNTLTEIIGEANYDVGHLFDDAPSEDQNNGNAGFIGAVCSDGRKGSAFVSFYEPEGPVFDLDYVAHELGHQFGANHTWSFDTEGTGVQVEPASGTTIMGYAGIVEGNDVAPNGDDYFHYVSILQIQDYIRTTSCSVNTALDNTPPVIDAQPNYVIPMGTPFVLSAGATDAEGDVMSYAWEQVDDGVVVSSTFGPENVSGANFRSLPPSTDSERYFPRLSRIIEGNLEQVNPQLNDAWETVSNIERELNFALTVRDNNPDGGQVASDSVKVDVIFGSGPFQVTSQSVSETYLGGSIQNITWDVADTHLPPINAETVDIFLSTDGGVDFPWILAENFPNNGNAQVQLPGTATSNARIMVKASNSVFLAVNSAEFTIQETQAVLNFDQLRFDGCQPDDISIPFVYEAYGGFSENMTLSINSSEAFTPNFSESSVLESGTQIELTLGNIANIPVGTHTVEVIATGQSFSTSTVIEINILNDIFTDTILTFPENMSAGIQVNPTFTWQEDVNTTSFDIEIALDEAFTSIVESSTVPFTFYQSTDLIPETQYFWRVRPKNQCGNGDFGTPFSFTTSVVNCSNFDTNESPQEISSVGTPTVRARILLVEDLRISDIDVNLEISHTFLQDLTVSLTSPSGTKVTLISRNCGSSNNINAVFDDEAPPLSCSENPAINGLVQPLGSLASFNGESTLGEWILEIQDTAASDGGSLDAFSLDICVEGTFRPDDDEDGVFDDGDDLCLGTPKGTLVDTLGCPINAFDANNFSITIQSESCRENNDGSISLSVLDTTIDYTATLLGNGIEVVNSFTEQTTFSNLIAGTYQLCIIGSNGATNYRETCFDVVIDEPEELSVVANLSANGATVQLQMSGGDFYNIELNGSVVQTTEDEISVDLEPGLNVLKVSAGLECQGVFEQQYFVVDSPTIVPNPAVDWVTVSSEFQDQEVVVTLYSAEGRLVRREDIFVEGYDFDINVSELSIGLYFLVLESEGTSQTSKLIKR